MLKAVLIVSILSVQSGWVVEQDRTEVQMPSMEKCEEARAAFAKRMAKPAEKATQWYAICRPAGVRS